MERPESLVDRIYEASVVPELWVPVLEDIAALTRTSYASIVTFSGQVLRWTGTPGALELIEAYRAVERDVSNPRLITGMGLVDAGVVTDFELVTPEQQRSHPFYDLLRAHGGGWAAGIFSKLPTGDFMIISAERPEAQGPVEPDAVARLEKIRRHLCRAALVSARLNLERARAMTDAFARLGLPAAALGPKGRLLSANPAFEAFIPSRFRDDRDRLRIVESGADGLLSNVMQWIGTGELSTSSIPVPGTETSPPLVVHVVPIRGAANDIFPAATFLLVVTPVTPKDALNASLLSALFDLTPSEARVARQIANGKSVAQSAIALGISQETVRTRLKAALAKTGLHRQAQLANLLTGLPEGRN